MHVGLAALMILSRLTLAFVAPKAPNSVPLSSQIGTPSSRKPPSASVSTQAFSMGFEAIHDVAPHVMGTSKLDVTYGTERVADGKHLTKAQVSIWLQQYSCLLDATCTRCRRAEVHCADYAACILW